MVRDRGGFKTGIYYVLISFSAVLDIGNETVNQYTLLQTGE